MYMQMISIYGSTCRTVAGFLRVYIPSCQSMGLGVYANGFHIWALLSHCRRLSQAPYPIPIHGHGCICKWFPYMGTPVALSQALSGPIPHPNTWAWVYMQMISIFGHTCRTVAGFLRAYIPLCQSIGLGVYANGFHIWTHLSHCRRFFQAPYPHANTWAWVYMQMVSVYGPICRTVTGSLKPYIPPSQYMGMGVYANGFHLWPHLSHCRRLSQAQCSPWQYIALGIHANDFHICIPFLQCNTPCQLIAYLPIQPWLLIFVHVYCSDFQGPAPGPL